ncbi:hypothetical protein BCV70DRAFT_233670 [Testicularia cyperi]|uniref:P-loop containing nucleoside triphosphate hydrolase protein n=1 Tax=Testicularia cyperi TaxID=1882483 RepID=A0A317XHF4_9BASI|nr:hypothetical protein BCV70DRAFT_233670 [Testicularia cyperi]
MDQSPRYLGLVLVQVRLDGELPRLLHGDYQEREEQAEIRKYWSKHAPIWASFWSEPGYCPLTITQHPNPRLVGGIPLDNSFYISAMAPAARLVHSAQPQFTQLIRQTITASQLQEVYERAYPSQEALLARRKDQIQDAIEQQRSDILECARVTYKRQQPPDLIKTMFFLHQEQALAWMLDCECPRQWGASGGASEASGSTLPDRRTGDLRTMRLWKTKKNQNGKITAWEHLITGEVRRTAPHICQGAILADDMGLGKSVTVLALIAETLPDARHFVRHTPSSADQSALRATLIICPKSLLNNWMHEFQKHWAADRQPNILAYKDQDRFTHLKSIKTYDVVITTYDTIVGDYKQHIQRLEKSKGKSRQLEEDEEQDSSAEDSDPFDGELFGESSSNDDEDEETSEDVAESSTLAKSPDLTLFDFMWFRVVLDEAHAIRNRRSQRSKAVCRIRSQRQQCLTGTPMYNSIDDLYSLFRFLRLDPFCNYRTWSSFCGQQKALTLAKTARGDRVSLDQENMGRVRKILKIFLMRRLKTSLDRDGNALIDIPPCYNSVVKLSLSSEERAAHLRINTIRELYNRARQSQDQTASRYLLENQILRLRRCCDHPALGLGPEEHVDIGQTEPSTKIRNLLGELIKFSRCNQSSALYDPSAPQFDHIDAKESSDPTIRANAAQVPVVLAERRSTSQQGTYKAMKSVVFSEWTTMLTLIGNQLDRADIKWNHIVGTMTSAEREASLEQFESKDEIEVLLVSVKAGGEGLNLISACRAYLMEPLWNIASEEQALNRIWRIGQTRPVMTVKYVMRNSIEEAVLLIQRRKYDLYRQVGMSGNQKALQGEAGGFEDWHARIATVLGTLEPSD